jgi:hypothetical protein
MATTKESRTAFYEQARRHLAVLKKRPKLKRKHLILLLTDVLTGVLLVLEEREPSDVKDSQK